MKKKKAKLIFKTFPFDKVFISRVYVDLENDIVYDKDMGIAIAYIIEKNTHMEIYFVIPETVDEDFNDNSNSIRYYLNMDYVMVKDFSNYYLRTSNGYYFLGKPYKDTDYMIKLPRLFDEDYYAQSDEEAEEELDEEAEEWIDPSCLHPDGTRKTPHEMVLELMHDSSK